jgi:hypothetical protein
MKSGKTGMIFRKKKKSETLIICGDIWKVGMNFTHEQRNRGKRHNLFESGGQCVRDYGEFKDST